MPNHVHVLLEMRAGHTLADVLHSWKSYTAKASNQLLGRSGPFWQPEYFDRAVRDEHHLAGALAYINANPVKAGLVSCPDLWPFSSAAYCSPTAGAGGPPALPEASGNVRLVAEEAPP